MQIAVFNFFAAADVGEAFDIYQSLHHSKNQIDLTVPKNISFTFKIDDKLFSALVSHVPFELKSILANIVNNSLESISGHGFVTVRAIDKDHKLVVTISDNGCGISSEVIDKVFGENFTHNKAGGSGLGLYHAKTFVDKWGGAITISSEIGVGTTVHLELPISGRKSWYVPRIKLSQSSKVFILDDQGLTHDLWRLRFKELGIENTVFNAKSLADIKTLLVEHKADLDSAVFLFDFDIQEKINGLHILKSLPSSATRCLVTGHYDDVGMQKDCEQSAIKLLPKSEISSVPFVMV